MFEQEINDTVSRISREVLGEKKSLPLSEIMSEERLPERFKPFFDVEARWWVHDDHLSRRHSRRFDYTQPELSSLLEYLEGVQVKYARFERDDFLRILDSAVKLTYNYLCRPQTTLRWYIFRGEPVKSLDEVMIRIDAFLDYPYFADLFMEWVERKQGERQTFESISAREFERIVRRIDDQILLSCSIDDLVDIMRPIYDFLADEEGRVMTDALIVFFDDKNIQKLVDHLEAVRERKIHLTLQEFDNELEQLLGQAEEDPDTDFSSVYQDDELDEVVREHLGRSDLGGTGDEPPAGVERSERSEPDFSSAAGLAATMSEAEAERSAGDESLPQDVRESSEGDSDPDESSGVRAKEEPGETEEKLTDHGQSRSENENQPFGESPPHPIVASTDPGSRFRGPEGVTDVREQIDSALEKKVVRKIFDRDADAYEAAIERINEAGSWREASVILDEIFIEHDIDPYSRTAVRFTDAVYARFLAIPSRS